MVKADSGAGSENDEDANMDETPTKKKSALNKVQGGRVTKASPRKAAAAKSYADPPSEDEETLEGRVKPESMEDENEDDYNNGGAVQYADGYGNGGFQPEQYAHGNGNGDENALQYYDAVDQDEA